MGTQRKRDRLPKRIRRGHRHNCPGCEYTGKNLLDHLEKKHPDVRKRYKRSQRGVWVLTEGYQAEEEDDDNGSEEEKRERDAEKEKDEDLREELREKEARISELEALLEEKERQMEDLRETRDRLIENSEEAISLILELVDDTNDPGTVGFDEDGGIAVEGSRGTTESAGGERAVKQVKEELNEKWGSEGENGRA